MQKFTKLFLALDATTKVSQKVAALQAYFAEAAAEDKLWAIALLTGRRPKGVARTADLRLWAAQLSGVPLWLFEETYHIVGDLAETIAKLIPAPESQVDRPLRFYTDLLLQLQKGSPQDREKAIKQTWQELSEWERFVFNKMMMGGYRLGVSQKLVVRALAAHLGREENEMAHRIMGNWQPHTTTFEDLLLRPRQQDDWSKPYPFYLASPLEGSPAALGDPAEWQVEPKWDGIRGQLITRGGMHYLWSRGEELIGAKFPEIEIAAAALPEGTVLDGEILAFRDGEILSFQHLQTRIGRNNLTKKILAQAPAVFRAYDLLEWQGEDWRQRPLWQRRGQLEGLFAERPLPEALQLAPLLKGYSWQELADIRARSRENQCEGLMLKHREGAYQVGRKKGQWWKWKIEPLVIDAVLIYAMRGHGRRANLYTDYTFALWDGEELVPFTKAYSGLTDAEFRAVDAFVKKNTLERFGPVRRVKPELVFELAFEGIQRSRRHKSGIALRFPRMSRWRRDKPVEEANHLSDLHVILDKYGS